MQLGFSGIAINAAFCINNNAVKYLKAVVSDLCKMRSDIDLAVSLTACPAFQWRFCR